MHRRPRRWVALAAALTAAALAAPAASAHAVLLATEPANDAVVRTEPAQITLRFNEPVETAFGSVRVYDAAARRVDEGKTLRPAPNEVAVRLRAGLARGTYTVSWRAVSADAHPVRGAFVFHIREAGANPGGVAQEVLGKGTPQGITIARDVVRGLGFGLLLLAAGGAVALALVVRGDYGLLREALGRRLALVAALLVPVSLAAIVLQGAAAGGFGLGQALHWEVISSVLDTRFGKVWLAQTGVAAALALTALAASRDRGADVGAVALAAGLAITPAAAGHAQATGTLAYAADTVHVAAASVWTGGLAFVALALWLARGERWRVAARLVPRFSLLAVGAVALLVAAGAVSGYEQVRTWRGLWETEYGILLLVKVGLVLPVIALGAWNNRFAVPRLRGELASGRERRRFLRLVGGELALVVAVVGVTAVLVAEPPARAQVAPRGPFSTDVKLGSLELNLVVDPAKAGPNQIHLYLLDRSGQPAEVADAQVQATLPSHRLGPLRLDAHSGGPGHYIVLGADLAIPGQWRLRVAARRGEFEQFDQTVSVPIRK